MGTPRVSSRQRPRPAREQSPDASPWAAADSPRRSPDLALGISWSLAGAAASSLARAGRAAAAVAAESRRVATPAARLAMRRPAVRRRVGVVQVQLRRLRATGTAARVHDLPAINERLRSLFAAIVAEVIQVVDLDEVVARLDVNAVADRIDVERLLQRIDVNAVVAEVDIENVVRESTGSMAGEMVDTLRLKSAGADRLLNRLVDSTLQRKAGREAAAPAMLPGAPHASPGF